MKLPRTVGRNCKEEIDSASDGRKVGLDPGKNNIVMMVSETNEKMRYTTAQRNFESGMLRYRKVLLKEKKKHGVEFAEKELSKLSYKTNDFFRNI